MVRATVRGGTIPHIAEARHTLTVRLQIGTVAQLAETLWDRDKLLRDRARREQASSGAAAEPMPVPKV